MSLLYVDMLTQICSRFSTNVEVILEYAVTNTVKFVQMLPRTLFGAFSRYFLCHRCVHIALLCTQLLCLRQFFLFDHGLLQ